MASYTKEFKQKIIKEYTNGKTTNQINRETKIAVSTINKWIRDSHTPRKLSKYTKEFKQKIIKEYTNGKTTNQIAIENNIPISTIYDWIGIPKTKESNWILEMKEIEPYQSQLSPKQQEVEVATPEEIQNISFQNVPDTEQQCSLPITFANQQQAKLYQLLEEVRNTIFDTLPDTEQQPLLNNTNPNIPKQTINVINNVENYNKLSNHKMTNL